MRRHWLRFCNLLSNGYIDELEKKSKDNTEKFAFYDNGLKKAVGMTLDLQKEIVELRKVVGKLQWQLKFKSAGEELDKRNDKPWSLLSDASKPIVKDPHIGRYIKYPKLEDSTPINRNIWEGLQNRKVNMSMEQRRRLVDELTKTLSLEVRDTEQLTDKDIKDIVSKLADTEIALRGGINSINVIAKVDLNETKQENDGVNRRVEGFESGGSFGEYKEDSKGEKFEANQSGRDNQSMGSSTPGTDKSTFGEGDCW